MPVTNSWVEKALCGHVVDIGQLTKADRRDLDRAVRAGTLRKYRGFWDTLSPSFGLGSPKTIWVAA